MQRDVEHEKKKLKKHEHDNFPKGAERTTHRFRADQKLRSNEEMFKLSDEEILPGPIITPHIEALGQKCCRGVYHMTKTQLAKIYRVHGEGIELYNGARGSDTFLALKDGETVEVTLPADPEFGWDMTNREDGFPCVSLKGDGSCGHHGPGKPRACKAFPFDQNMLRTIPTCSYTFDATGTTRSGECDGCVAKLQG